MTDNEIVKALYYLSCAAKYKETVTMSRETAVGLYEHFNRQKAKIERLEYTLLGVMHSVDKWLDGAELEQDEVNRAATMREKTLQIIERLQKNIQEGVDLAKQIPEMLAMAQAEAIKDFAERLKELYTDKIITDDMHCSVAVIKANIDDVVKEMIGEQE